MSAFNFPDLPIDEICRSLSQLVDVDISEVWFKNPDPNQWIDLCRQFVSQITGSPEDFLLQPPLFMGVDSFDYPEVCSEAVPVMQLIAAMTRIMPTLYVSDFSGSDILAPTTKRMRKICCAVIIFLSFKHSREPIYEDVKAEIEKEREHHDALVRRNDEIKQKISKIRADRAQQEPDVQKFQAEVEKISMRMQEQQRAKQTLQLQATEIKTSNAEKKAKSDQLKCEILKSKEEGEKLSLKIVQSPEKVRAEEEHLQLQLADLKSDFERKRYRLSEIEGYRKYGRQAKIDGEKGKQILEAMKVNIDKGNAIQTEVAQIHDKIQEQKELERELCIRKEQLQQMLSARQEKLSKLSMQHQSRLRVLQETLETCQSEKEEFLAKQNCGAERKTKLTDDKKRYKQEILAKQKNTEKEIERLQELYAKVLEKTDAYNRVFGEGWNEIKQLIKE